MWITRSELSDTAWVTTSHVGTGALTCPVERSSASFSVPRIALYPQKGELSLACPDEGVWAYAIRGGAYRFCTGLHHTHGYSFQSLTHFFRTGFSRTY